MYMHNNRDVTYRYNNVFGYNNSHYGIHLKEDSLGGGANQMYDNTVNNNNVFVISEISYKKYALAIRILEDAVASVGEGTHNSTKDASLVTWRGLIAKYSGILHGGYICLVLLERYCNFGE